MSLRPRFAGDGRLRVPVRVQLWGKISAPKDEPAFVGHFGDASYDPFERVASGLLLAEEFARADLRPGDAAVDWFLRHGALDIIHFLPPDPLAADPPVTREAFHDEVRDIQAQQRNVQWHLFSLARVSDYLAAGGGELETVPDGRWDPRWAEPAFAIGRDLLWLGGQTPRQRHIGWDMRLTPEPIGVTPPEMTDDGFRDWWAQAHASYQHIVADGVPILWYPAPEMRFRTWEAQAALDDPIEHSLSDGIGTDPWSLVELQRRLMALYITRAGDHRVELGWPDSPAPARSRRPLVVHERRTWDSLLAPVYVQLLEGLRRVTEGHRGAAFCKECGRPFLTLDARRSSFCTDRERFRYGQREHRKRVSAQDTLAIRDYATIRIEHGGVDR